MRGAIIDLGTNTFNLIVFEKNVSGLRKTLTSYKHPVNLGMGGINEKIISPDAEHRAFLALEDFLNTCRKFKVEKIAAFGTSALRDARNTPEFVEKAKELFGIDIQVISGMEEARLIFEGVRSVHKFSAPSCIMDIGGGSTEFIFVDQKGITGQGSFDIGVSRVIQQYDLTDPLSDEDITVITTFFDRVSQDYFKDKQATELIGASGSFETFYEMVTGNEASTTRSLKIPFKELHQALDYLIFSSTDQRKENNRIPEFRVPMIHVAALKTKWIMEKLKIKQCSISPASLKEGAMETLF